MPDDIPTSYDLLLDRLAGGDLRTRVLAQVVQRLAELMAVPSLPQDEFSARAKAIALDAEKLTQ